MASHQEKVRVLMARNKKLSTAQPVLLTVPDVAIQLGVCRQTVYPHLS